MTSSRQRPWVVLCLGAAAVAQVMCTGGEVHRGGAGPDGGASPDAPTSTGAGGSRSVGSGEAVSTTGAAGSMPVVGPVGTCAVGFNRCFGLCMESATIGADCKVAMCAVPTGATPPVRATITSRGFDWNVAFEGGTTTVTFKPGKGTVNQATLAVDLFYRAPGGMEVTKVPMTAGSDGAFTVTSTAFKANDDLDFYFHSTMARQTIVMPSPDIKPLLDTMWFHQKLGAARDPEPAYPLTAKLAGRFRDRHPNEERYDHYVDTYMSGPTFDLTIVDHGNALDVTIAPQAAMDVQAVDFKNYEAMGSGQGGALPAPTPLCFTPPAIAAVGVRAKAMGNSVWENHVDNLSYGQLVDFELTFVRSRTYYTEWFEYFVGSGRLQPKVQHPWAHAAGDQSITDVSTDEFGYAQHIPNLSPKTLDDFITGKVLFEADFESLAGYNPSTTYDCPRGSTPGTKVPVITTPPLKSPLFTAGNSYTNMPLASIARPGFTSSACFGCHHLDGKGAPADAKGMGQILLKLFSGAQGEADPTYGTILDTHVHGAGTPEATPSITWQTLPGKLADGTAYELRKPVFAAGAMRDGPLAAGTHVSARVPRPVFGLGFLEAVPAATILGLADPDDANGDKVSGRPNFVKDPKTGTTQLGRFGWKAGTSSLREQAALAFVNDIGITSPLYPKHRCGAGQAACTSAVAGVTAPQLTDTDLDHVQSYLRGLSVPPRRNYEDPAAIAGKNIFAAIGCSKCHVPNLVTSSTFEVPELRNLAIQPFTDLLLHDMGEGLADDAPLEEGSATGREWRTPPLWGNGTGMAVMLPAIDAFDPNANPPPGGVYLHDGRARSITEAVLWHGGEAQAMRDAFVALPADARAQLLAYVAYPFEDPIPLRSCAPSTAP